MIRLYLEMNCEQKEELEKHLFHLQYLDIRYDRSFNKSNKSKWLEEWARNYWCGKNGAWSVKEIDIVPIKEQF